MAFICLGISFYGASRVIHKNHASGVANILPMFDREQVKAREAEHNSSRTFTAPSRSHIEDLLLFEHSVTKSIIDKNMLEIKPTTLSIDHTL